MSSRFVLFKKNCVAKEFFKDILNKPGYIADRRHILRQRAGLRVKDGRVTWLSTQISVFPTSLDTAGKVWSVLFLHLICPPFKVALYHKNIFVVFQCSVHPILQTYYVKSC